MSETVLVTGGLGFIGLHTVRALLSAGCDVVLTRFRLRRDAGDLLAGLPGRVAVETADVTSPYSLFDLMSRCEVGSVVHLAVPGLNRLSAADEAAVNLNGLVNVLEAARIQRVRQITVASSVTVYDGVAPGPWSEGMPLPIESSSPTEAFKKVAETLANHYADRTGLPLCIARIGRIWGPLYHSMANLPSRLAHLAAGRLDGSAVNAARHAAGGGDYCYVKDCARALQLLHTAPRLSYRTYNVSAGAYVTNAELVQAVTETVPRFRLSTGMDPGDPRSPAYMDVTRLCQDTGFRPEFTPARAMADYLDWLKGHEQ